MMTIFQPFANTLWNSLKDTEITKVPKTDLRDTGDSYVLEADMPGFRKEEIKLSLEGDVLTIAAEHTAEKQNEKAPEKDGESGETKTAEQPESKGTYLQRERSFCKYLRRADPDTAEKTAGKAGSKTDRDPVNLLGSVHSQVLPLR